VIGFTTISRLERFKPIDAPLPPQWFLVSKPDIKYPAIDTDLEDAPLTRAQRATFERVLRTYIRIVRRAILEQETGVKRLALQQLLSSNMPSGKKFTAIDITGRVFAGHIITNPVGHQNDNASLLLAFDDPITVLNLGDKESLTSIRTLNKGQVIEVKIEKRHHGAGGA
jgi:hypothetical protein